MYQFRSGSNSLDIKTHKSNSSLHKQTNSGSSSSSPNDSHVVYKLKGNHSHQDNISKEHSGSLDSSVLLSNEFPVDSKISYKK